MVIIRLNLGRPAAPASIEGKPFVSASASLSRFYFPARGVVYSLLIHAGLFLGSFFVPLTPIPAALLQPPVQAAAAEPWDPLDVIYIPILPEVDPGLNEAAAPAPPARNPRETAARQTKQESEPVREETLISAAPATEGLSYPGPQPILSDPPDPTNLIQTVLQPELVNPAILIPPIPLPNLVEMAYVAPPPMIEPPEPEMPAPDATEPLEQELEPPLAQQQDAKTVAPPISETRNTPAPPVEIPKPLPLPKLDLVLPPVAPPPSPPAAPVPRDAQRPEPPAKRVPQPKPEPEPKTLPPVSQVASVVKEAPLPEPPSKPPEPPKVETQAQTAEDSHEISEQEVPAGASGQINRLSLTPMPAPPEQQPMVPEGEARGRFAISPEPNLTATGSVPGLKSAIPPSPAVAIGNSPTAPPEVAASTSSPPVVTVGFGQKPTAAKSNEVSAGATPSASTPGAGSAATPKPARSPFSGITIVGGVAPPRSAANPSIVVPPQTIRPLQTSYGLTVISTENSGGGLPSFGVFSNQPIYTVYLDMRQTENDSGPSWTLEFAVISEPDQSANTANQSSRSLQGLVLPFPALKECPALPAELVRRNLGKMIIVYGVVNTGGEIEQLSVKESPDALLDRPVLDALSRWKFRAAQLNGEAVSVKLLMGIPLWLPQ